MYYQLFLGGTNGNRYIIFKKTFKTTNGTNNK